MAASRAICRAMCFVSACTRQPHGVQRSQNKVSGLAEPMGALIGFLIFRTVFNEALFGISFAFCAGIMVYVALNELLPVAKEYGEPSDTIIGVTIGMIIMAISLIMMYA